MSPGQARRGNTPGPVKARTETKKPGDYAELITGGMLALAQALAGFGLRKPAARVARGAQSSGQNIERLAQEDKRVARFLEWVLTPGVWGAALSPIGAIVLGCAADAGALEGTPVAGLIKPMSDEEADEILAAHKIEPPPPAGAAGPLCPDGNWPPHYAATVLECLTCVAQMQENERARAG